MLNPSYIKNQAKLEQRFRNLVSARADILTKGSLTPAERAAMLVASGDPSESLMHSFKSGGGYSDDGERLEDDSDEDDYGIISGKQLKSRVMQDDGY